MNTVVLMRPSGPARSLRLGDLEAPVGAVLARSGLSFSQLVQEALRSHIDAMPLMDEADLIEGLNDFAAATFVLDVDDNEIGVTVTDVERRTTDPLGRPYSPTQAPLEHFVGVEARPEPDGRATVELVGLPGTSEAGVRAFVAQVPAQPGVSVTVPIMALHPLSRGDVEDVADQVSA